MKSGINIRPYQKPLLLDDASILSSYVKSLSKADLMRLMKLSPKLAEITYNTWKEWGASEEFSPAIDSFIGDIYSGLQSQNLSDKDRIYANDNLYILSGLYGILRALDSIQQYRLEMGYRLTGPYKNIYHYWGDKLALQIPEGFEIINLTSNEYSKAIIPYLRNREIITPKFMTLDSNSVPKFVAVHAKIARGAFANWMIKERVNDYSNLIRFNKLGYAYSNKLSTLNEPVYICGKFMGLGLSIRNK